ncbi:MAG: acyl-CoA reductase [Terracidiphilus sp.]
MRDSTIQFQLDVASPEQIADAAASLRQAVLDREVTPDGVLTVFEAWAKKLDARELDEIPGILFLRMWLRRGTLEPIVTRELGPQSLHGGWNDYGRARCKAYPLGVVGHWPAANVEIQPILSMTCSLLGGNAALVRIPGDLKEVTRILIERLADSDPGEILMRRIFLAAFEHGRRDLHEAMAKAVDGAMIWGGRESVLQVRSLPFPHWARLAVFGPRISVAAMDAGAWTDPAERKTWCTRLARDVWQFDQQACSSPQVLFLEKDASHSIAEFVPFLQTAFEEENRQHPRAGISASLTSAIAQARASWLLEDTAHTAVFPKHPDWTLLIGSGSDIPQPAQGKTLTVLEVENLLDPIAKFDGNVQTLGLGISNPEKEEAITGLAGRRGVDRIVKLGRMHLFVPPWDGLDLIRPMVRMVRHVSSAD